MSSKIINCEYCNKIIGELQYYCDSCKKLSLNHNINYFELFGIPKNSYNFDKTLMHAKFIEYHKLINNNEQQASLINNAYHTLSHKNLLLKYILELKNIKINEHIAFDAEMLEEVFEIREAIYDAVDYKTLEKIFTNTEAKLAVYEARIDQILEKNDFNEINQNVIDMFYYFKILEEIKERKMLLI